MAHTALLEATARDEAAIRDLVAASVEHQNDVDAFVSLLTDDVTIVNIAGLRVQGRTTFREAMAEALTTHLANVFTTTEVVDVRFVTPRAAVVSCIKRVTDTNNEAASKLPKEANLTYLAVKERDGWRIALAQSTPIAG